MHRNVSSVPAHSCPEQLEVCSGCTLQTRPPGAQPLASSRGEVRRWTGRESSLASIRRPAAFVCWWVSLESFSFPPARRSTSSLLSPGGFTPGEVSHKQPASFAVRAGPSRAEPSQAGPGRASALEARGKKWAWHFAHKAPHHPDSQPLLLQMMQRRRAALSTKCCGTTRWCWFRGVEGFHSFSYSF